MISDDVHISEIDIELGLQKLGTILENEVCTSIYKDKLFLWHTDNKSTAQAQSNVLIWNTWIVRIVLLTLKF